MRKMRQSSQLFVALSSSVSFVGKAWWTLMLALRLSLLLLMGSTLFGDEQERFVCNTIQPGCSTVCFDAFAPVSVLRLWLLHLLLLALPHLLFATYVVHEVLAHRKGSGGPECERSCGDSPAGWSPEAEAALLQEPAGARFCCAYVLVVVLRILLEAAFGAGQFLLFGLSFPKSVLCYEAPCTSGVECFVSRRTEKSLMLVLMLAVASLSILLSLLDLISSVKAVLRGRRRRRRREELTKGDQSSVFTATTSAEDGDKSPEWKHRDPRGDTPPTPTGAPAPPGWVLHSRLGPPPAPRPDGGTLRSPGQNHPARTPSDPQAHSSPAPDRRAWV